MELDQYLILEKQVYGETAFYEVASGIEIFWNLLFIFLILIFTYRIIQRIRKYLEMKENYQRSEEIFLLVPSVIGLLLCLMTRSMMFSTEGYDFHSIFDSRPELNLLIPCISLLCIILIIFAAKMLRKLIDESNQKIEVSVYQERIREMEQHIGDIENLYAGIRGMKHDMKNYIADIDALMKEESGKHSDQTALKQYLDSMQTSFFLPVLNMDSFDLSIIINNALDNALEACRRQKEGRKTIELNAYRRENMFFIIVKNSFDGVLARNKSDGRLLTTKPDPENHGMGLRNIEVCAEKYYGKVETTVKDKEFELAVMLQERISR